MMTQLVKHIDEEATNFYRFPHGDTGRTPPFPQQVEAGWVAPNLQRALEDPDAF